MTQTRKHEERTHSMAVTVEPTGNDLRGEVAIVAAGNAWPFYSLNAAYVCQAGRTFRSTRWLGFYSSKTIHGVAAQIQRVEDQVELTQTAAARRSMSTDPADRRLGFIIAAALDGPWQEGSTCKVMVLSGADDPATVRFDSIPHTGPAAWTMGQRYADLGQLTGAASTDDLIGDQG